MLDRLNTEAEEIALDWMSAFGRALRDGTERALYALFVRDSHWRNLFGFSWRFETISGADRLVRDCFDSQARYARANSGSTRRR